MNVSLRAQRGNPAKPSRVAARDLPNEHGFGLTTKAPRHEEPKDTHFSESQMNADLPGEMSTEPISRGKRGFVGWRLAPPKILSKVTGFNSRTSYFPPFSFAFLCPLCYVSTSKAVQGLVKTKQEKRDARLRYPGFVLVSNGPLTESTDYHTFGNEGGRQE